MLVDVNESREVASVRALKAVVLLGLLGKEQLPRFRAAVELPAPEDALRVVDEATSAINVEPAIQYAKLTAARLLIREEVRARIAALLVEREG